MSGVVTIKILVACEWSGRVRDAFIDRGHEAYSCDLTPSYGYHTNFHIKGDVREHLGAEKNWDMIVAFPPCTYLSRANGTAYGSNYQLNAINFVRDIMDAPCEKIAVENPIGALTKAIRPADQIIEPYWFGEPYTKATCLWLKNLPLLKPSDKVVPIGPYVNPNNRNAKRRGITFQGVANAMAKQWSNDETI